MEKLYWGPTDVAAYANIGKIQGISIHSGYEG